MYALWYLRWRSQKICLAGPRAGLHQDTYIHIIVHFRKSFNLHRWGFMSKATYSDQRFITNISDIFVQDTTRHSFICTHKYVVAVTLFATIYVCSIRMTLELYN